MGTEDPADVVFLLGAGASKAADVPDTYEFVREFQESLDSSDPDSAVLRVIVRRLQDWSDERVDIELILEALTRIVERTRDPGLVFCRDQGLSDDVPVEAAKRLIAALRDCIKSRTYVEPDQTLHLDPLMAFIRHHGRIDIATVICIPEFASFDLVAKGAHHGGGERGFTVPTTLGIVLSLAGDRPMDRTEPFHLRRYGW